MNLRWKPLRRDEVGWAIYEPLVAHEIGTVCPAATPAFAGYLTRWQAARRLPATGVMDAATFAELARIWESRRPFVAQSKAACPPAPPLTSLARAAPQESYGGKAILLRPAALTAYRRMTAAARAALPSTAADRRLLTIFSAFRSPGDDAARCARENNCQGVTRAACSSHRTGVAVDLFLGTAPGLPPESSDDANRAFQARSPAYRWLVRNAARFGFVNYPFEPWHWEWVGRAG